MKCKDKKELLDTLMKEAENPKAFIYSVMALQGQTTREVSKLAGMSTAHFYVLMHVIESGKGSTGAETCERIAIALDIDPYILYRVISDYNWKCFIDGKRKN